VLEIKARDRDKEKEKDPRDKDPKDPKDKGRKSLDGELKPSSSSDSLSGQADEGVTFEIVKVYGSVLREHEKSKKIMIPHGTPAMMIIQETLSKYKVADPTETYCLVAIDEQGNEVSVPDEECPMYFHPEYHQSNPVALGRHLSFHIRKVSLPFLFPHPFPFDVIFHFHNKY